MQEGSKQKKMKEGILQGVSSFIFKNPDKAGNVSVFDVLMAVDCRSAKVFISCDNISDISKLVRHKQRIYDEIKQVFETKYLPSIDFIQVKNEENNI